MTWTLKKLLDWTTNYLAEKGIDSSRLDAELLIAFSLGISRIQIYTQFDRPLSEAELQSFKPLLQRRAAREPLAYLLGQREFYSINFRVGPGVLIPRPESEALVDMGLAHLQGKETADFRLLDLATGSGCILLSLLKQLPQARGLGVDRSQAALAWARRNAQELQLEERVQFREENLMEDCNFASGQTFSLITANLPYVPEVEWSGLAPEVKDHEPKEALVAGPHGTELFQTVIPKVQQHLEAGGMALLEIGADQGRQVSELARGQSGVTQLRVIPDLSGQDRVVQWIKNSD